MNVPALGPADNDRLAVAVILVTVFALALGDAVIKGISAEFTLWQIFSVRSAIVLPALLLVVRLRRRKLSFWPHQPGWTVLRSLMLTLMWIAYYAALPHVELSLAAAAYYTLPLFITLFAALFLGDRIGRLGWGAVVAGFVGVLLVLQPKAEAFNWFSALPIASAILYALAMILTRSRCRGEDALVLSAWLNLTMLATGVLVSILLALRPPRELSSNAIAFVLGAWTPMGWDEWRAIALLSVTIIVGSIGAAIAYQVGRSATVATFDFAYVAFAALWGFVLFDELPGLTAAAGIALIVLAGILAIRDAAGRGGAGRPAEVDAQRGSPADRP